MRKSVPLFGLGTPPWPCNAHDGLRPEACGGAREGETGSTEEGEGHPPAKVLRLMARVRQQVTREDDATKAMAVADDILWLENLVETTRRERREGPRRRHSNARDGPMESPRSKMPCFGSECFGIGTPKKTIIRVIFIRFEFYVL